MSIDPEQLYALLRAGGAIEAMPGGAAFWSRLPQELDALGRAWLVSEFCCNEDWSSWERHPGGDEFVYLLDGEVEMLIEQAGGLQRTRLSGRGAVIVPRGCWHTAKVAAPSRLLFITWGEGTEHRPA